MRKQAELVKKLLVRGRSVKNQQNLYLQGSRTTTPTATASKFKHDTVIKSNQMCKSKKDVYERGGGV